MWWYISYMPDQPLQAFAPPNTLFERIPEGYLTPGLAIEWFIYLAFAFWAVYTLVATYHWLKYSHASWVAYPAIALHIFVSLSLIFYILI